MQARYVPEGTQQLLLPLSPPLPEGQLLAYRRVADEHALIGVDLGQAPESVGRRMEKYGNDKVHSTLFASASRNHPASIPYSCCWCRAVDEALTQLCFDHGTVHFELRNAIACLWKSKRQSRSSLRWGSIEAAVWAQRVKGETRMRPKLMPCSWTLLSLHWGCRGDIRNQGSTREWHYRMGVVVTRILSSDPHPPHRYFPWHEVCVPPHVSDPA